MRVEYAYVDLVEAAHKPRAAAHARTHAPLLPRQRAPEYDDEGVALVVHHRHGHRRLPVVSNERMNEWDPCLIDDRVGVSEKAQLLRFW